MKANTRNLLICTFTIVSAAVDAINDTRKEYLSHIESLEDAYKKLKALKEKGIGGDVYVSARVDYLLAHKKVEGDSFLWGKLVPRNKRVLVYEMDEWVKADM